MITCFIGVLPGRRPRSFAFCITGGTWPERMMRALLSIFLVMRATGCALVVTVANIGWDNRTNRKQDRAKTRRKRAFFITLLRDAVRDRARTQKGRHSRGESMSRCRPETSQECNEPDFKNYLQLLRKNGAAGRGDI